MTFCRVQVVVRVGRFSVNLMAERAILSLVYVDVEEEKVASSLHLYGELYSRQASCPASQYRST